MTTTYEMNNTTGTTNIKVVNDGVIWRCVALIDDRATLDEHLTTAEADAIEAQWSDEMRAAQAALMAE